VRFSDVIGHRPLVSLLSRAVARGTLPPALLLAGPPGVGKWRVARTLAAAVNCLNPDRPAAGDLALDACGFCRACDRVQRGVHVDVLALEPDDKASIKIDLVREVLEQTSFRPFEGKRRLVTIREADTLEPQAQNALLKSLEEPPAGTVFVLTSAMPGVLLPTVRSRLMRLAFGRLSEADVTRVLVERHEYAEREARAAAALADGSVANALALGSTDFAVLREMAMLLLTQAAANGPAASRLQAAATVVGPPKNERSREELTLILRLLASMLRDLELLHLGGVSRGLANPALADELARLRTRFGADRVRGAFSAVDRAIVALGRNAGSKVVADWLSVQL
jgi:DNA polymerase-3 subunit delta'